MFLNWLKLVMSLWLTCSRRAAGRPGWRSLDSCCAALEVPYQTWWSWTRSRRGRWSVCRKFKTCICDQMIPNSRFIYYFFLELMIKGGCKWGEAGAGVSQLVSLFMDGPTPDHSLRKAVRSGQKLQKKLVIEPFITEMFSQGQEWTSLLIICIICSFTW